MKSIAALGFAALALGAGCGKSASSECETSIRDVLDRSLSSDGEDVPDQVKSMLHRMGDELTKRCNEDKWDASVLECLDKANDPSAAKECATKLTPHQLTKLNKSLGELMGVPLGDQDKPKQ